MQDAIRSSDVCARLGGDEFLAVLSNCDVANGGAKALALQAAIKDLNVEVQPDMFARVSISFGVAAYPDDGESLEQLLEAADARMYTNKRQRPARETHVGAQSDPREPVTVP